MLFFNKHRAPQKISTEYYVDPSKVTNGCFLVFRATSKDKPKPVFNGMGPDEVRLEIDIYRDIKTIQPEADALGVPTSKPYTICKYWRTLT